MGPGPQAGAMSYRPGALGELDGRTSGHTGAGLEMR